MREIIVRASAVMIIGTIFLANFSPPGAAVHGTYIHMSFVSRFVAVMACYRTTKSAVVLHVVVLTTEETASLVWLMVMSMLSMMLSMTLAMVVRFMG